GALDLEGALGHVVGGEIAGDGALGLLAREVARALADDDAELDLVVELGRLARHDGVVVRPADAGDRLVEDDRLLRDWHAGFRGVVPRHGSCRTFPLPAKRGEGGRALRAA